MKRRSTSTPFAKKSLGQNFLTDPNYIKKIIDAVEPSAGDTIVEIGPGRGALTEKLIESEAGVIAVELDRELASQLRDRFARTANFRVVESDALEIEFESLVAISPEPATRNARTSKLVANLPYYISTAILQRLAEQREVFSELILMFQKEVVERITAKPGNSERAFLTVIVEASFEVEKLFDVPPAAFRPVPKVWSSVVRLTPKPPLHLDESVFRDLISSSFAQKRKTILNNLKLYIGEPEGSLQSAGIDSKRRAESLTLEEWLRLADIVGQHKKD